VLQPEAFNRAAPSLGGRGPTVEDSSFDRAIKLENVALACGQISLFDSLDGHGDSSPATFVVQVPVVVTHGRRRLFCY
jgi:hypothetical protein